MQDKLLIIIEPADPQPQEEESDDPMSTDHDSSDEEGSPAETVPGHVEPVASIVSAEASGANHPTEPQPVAATAPAAVDGHSADSAPPAPVEAKPNQGAWFAELCVP